MMSSENPGAGSETEAAASPPEAASPSQPETGQPSAQPAAQPGAASRPPVPAEGEDGDRSSRSRRSGRGVRVDGNLEKAIRQFRKRIERQGLFRELRKRRFYEKPSERRKRKQREAEKRRRKKSRHD